MSLVGNRPLPENVIAAIRRDYPQVEEALSTHRWSHRPVQLAGESACPTNSALRWRSTIARGTISVLDVARFLILLLHGVGGGAAATAFHHCGDERLLMRSKAVHARSGPSSLHKGT